MLRVQIYWLIIFMKIAIQRIFYAFYFRYDAFQRGMSVNPCGFVYAYRAKVFI